MTIDGETYRLPDRFMVIATQNPIEQQGVYPLPEAQLDRFLFKHRDGLSLGRGGEEDRRRPWRPLRRAAARGLGDRAQRRPCRASPRRSASVAAIPMVERGGRLCRRPGPRDPRGARPGEPAPPRARRRCWPAPRAPAPRSTAATMSSPTTSRRWRLPVLRHRVILSARRRDRGPAGRERDQPADRTRSGRRVDLPDPPPDPRRRRGRARRRWWSALIAPACWTAGLGLLALLLALALARRGARRRRARAGRPALGRAACGRRRRELRRSTARARFARRAPRGRRVRARRLDGPVAAPGRACGRAAQAARGGAPARSR